MAYLYLVCAIALEVAGTFCLKLSNGFANPLPSGLAFMFYGLMNVPLILALKHFDLTIVYVTWSAMGVVAAVALGIFWFGEEATVQRIAFAAIALVGVVGLNASFASS